MADFECRHGRLPGDRTSACGCWPEERRIDEILRERAVPLREAA